MNNELQAILSYMEKERGIDREKMLQAIEFAVDSASRKSMGPVRNLRIDMDRKTLDLRAFATATVIDSDKAGKDEISLFQAKKIKSDVKIGDDIEIEVTPKNFGRVAAQAAKQAIIQKIKQAEKDMVYEEFKDRIGEIVSGTIRQFNKSDIILDLGRGEGIITSKERVPTEEYQVGDRIRAMILSLQGGPASSSVLLSRTHPDFIRNLFKIEVSEIAEGIVEIKAIAREPGFRTKIAVISHDEKVDPVGACVGMRGMRVKNIVRELSGEKIDIVRWSDDIKTYVANALSPAKLLKVYFDENIPSMVHVVTDAEQLSLAIGKRGQNVRLTAKLLGWKIDIQKDGQDVSFSEKVAKAVQNLASVPGIGAEYAEKLVNAGFLTVEGILASDIKDIAETSGLDESTVTAIFDAAAAVQPEIKE